MPGEITHTRCGWIANEDPATGPGTQSFQNNACYFTVIHPLFWDISFSPQTSTVVQPSPTALNANLIFQIANYQTATSSWKVVEVLRRIGAKVKEGIIEYGETKKSMFSDEKKWKKIASIAAKGALVWVFGGPDAGLTSLGAVDLPSQSKTHNGAYLNHSEVSFIFILSELT
jgi:hypothetical protein